MKILITGSLSLSNKGTAAIVISTIEEIKKIFSDVEIFVELVYPEKQRTIMQIEDKNVKIIEPLFQKPIKGSWLFFIAFIYFLFGKVGININKLIIKDLKLYKEADLIIDLSAEGFVKFYSEVSNKYKKRFLIHIYPVLVAIFLKNPVIMLAQTLAPFGIFNPIMKYVIKNARLVTLRDVSSIKNLEKEGIDTSGMQITADPAFLLKESLEEDVNKILKTEKIEIDEKKFQGKKVIGICGVKFPNNGEKILKEMAESIDAIISEFDAEIVFIPHSSGKIMKKSDDVSVGLEIAKYISNKNKYTIIKGDYTPQELKGIIGKLDLLISLRMHPVIFAFSMGVPSIIIAFNDKAYGLVQKFDMEEYIVDARKIKKDSILQKTRKIFTNYDEERNKLKKAYILVREQSLKNFENLISN